MSTPQKRPASNKNSMPVRAFIPYTATPTSTVKWVRRQVLKDVTPAQLNKACQSWIVKEKERAQEEELRLRQAKEEKERQATEHLKQMEQAQIAAGYLTLYVYLADLLATNDQQFHLRLPKCSLIIVAILLSPFTSINLEQQMLGWLPDWRPYSLKKEFNLALYCSQTGTLCNLSGYSADAMLKRCNKKDVVSSLGFFLLSFQLFLTVFRFSAPLCVSSPKWWTKRQVNFRLSQPFTSLQVEHLTRFLMYSIILASGHGERMTSEWTHYLARKQSWPGGKPSSCRHFDPLWSSCGSWHFWWTSLMVFVCTAQVMTSKNGPCRSRPMRNFLKFRKLLLRDFVQLSG